MTTQEAIEALKELNEWLKIYYRVQAMDGIAALDVVIAEVERHEMDMDSFAEWLFSMTSQWVYDPTDKVWFQKHSTETKTTTQLRELWEKEKKK